MNKRLRFASAIAVGAAVLIGGLAPGTALAVDERLDLRDFGAVAAAQEARVLGSTIQELSSAQESQDHAAASSSWTITASSDGGVEASGQSAWGVECTGQVNHPHFSKGAGGAIFKTVVSCKGTGTPTVTVQQRGLLSFATTDTSPLEQRATSDYPQVIAVNGKSETFYTPQQGNGGRGNGYWVATSTWQITSPGLGTIGTQTVPVKANI